MLAGLLRLGFNPSFWVAAGIIAVSAYGGGFIHGWSSANVAAYREQIAELRKAAAQRDAIIEADAERKLNDLAQKSRLEERLHEILSNQTDACKLSDADISRLQQLAGDG